MCDFRSITSGWENTLLTLVFDTASFACDNKFIFNKSFFFPDRKILKKLALLPFLSKFGRMDVYDINQSLTSFY